MCADASSHKGIVQTVSNETLSLPPALPLRPVMSSGYKGPRRVDLRKIDSTRAASSNDGAKNMADTTSRQGDLTGASHKLFVHAVAHAY